MGDAGVLVGEGANEENTAFDEQCSNTGVG